MSDTYTAEQIADMNQQYSPRISVPDAEAYLAANAAESAAVRDRLECKLDIAFGDSDGQKLDIFPAATANAPVHVFIHGGYWRALDKHVYSHVAAPLVAAGATAVLVNYDLCPAVRVTDIVQQMRRALAWVHGNIADYGGNPENIHISGHSAGGHLGAMLIATDWGAFAGLPNNLIKSSVLLSGLYDIRPHRFLDVQADIHLTADEAVAMSPMGLPAVTRTPVLLPVGEHEPNLFHWQSLAYAAKLRAEGIKAEYISSAGDNHFSITDRLGDGDDALTRRVLAHMGL
jgi:arylformamidase